jgi:hypothetical protein
MHVGFTFENHCKVNFVKICLKTEFLLCPKCFCLHKSIVCVVLMFTGAALHDDTVPAVFEEESGDPSKAEGGNIHEQGEEGQPEYRHTG